MEKLIDLLRKYIRTKYEYGEYGVYINKQNKLILEKQNGFMGYGIDEEWYDDMEFGESIIISKQFLFIKWLVENNKIDRDRVREIDISISFHDEYNGFYSDDEKELLMLLSIQENPTEFLNSILK